MSPRHGLLKIVTNAPENVAGRFLPTGGDCDDGVPGLRLVAGDWDSCLLRHVPTGAEMLITRRRDTRRPVEGESRTWLDSASPLEAPLSRAERMALGSVPPISPDAAVLLSALVSRLNVTDRVAQWATGLWHGDPLGREREWSEPSPNRMLWGAGDHWDFRWYGCPRPSDLRAALTDERIAVDGIMVDDHGRRTYLARLGTADMVIGWPD